jgi:hypothetical protein
MKDFECHITVEANVKDRNALERCGESFGWKTSFIQGDPDLGAGNRFFFTKHFDNFDLARDKTNEMATIVKDFGSIRKKIEEVLMDTRAGNWT